MKVAFMRDSNGVIWIGVASFFFNKKFALHGKAREQVEMFFSGASNNEIINIEQ